VRVLIADDDLVSRSLLRRVLHQWGFEVETMCDGAQAWEALQHPDAPSLVVLDWMMPGMDGVEVCRRVRGLQAENPPYIVLLTARDGKGDIVTGLDAGANDYVGKPFDRDELLARLQVGRRFVELNGKLLETQKTLARLARTDALTGAMNRRAILEELDRRMTEARSAHRSLGIGVLDIDHFKRINDEYGHAAGDSALREVVERSVSSLTDDAGQTFGRIGGEEFLVVLPDTDRGALTVLLEHMRRAVASSPVRFEDFASPVTVSIGGALDHGRSVDDLMKAADAALYRAKADGRDRVVISPA
jgi:two-component system, cell cycle response regulator